MSAQSNMSDDDPARIAMIERIKTYLKGGWTTGAEPVDRITQPSRVARRARPNAPERNPGDWDVERLRTLIRNELAGSDVIIVSNREPYVHSKTEDGIRCQVPAGGLVSALEPIARGCGGTWIAHGSGSGDRATVDAHDHIQVPPANPDYTLRRVWLSEEEEKGYYVGFANESLWPLCHNAFVRPIFREADWEHYRAVNARFADAVKEESQTDAPIVIVQDYHFALLPRMIRERLPNATIVTFWHIPWPNGEVFGICPYAAEILDGLLGSDIIGFQVPLFRINFIDCVERTLESRINNEDCSVRYGGKVSRIRTYPISIAWPPERDHAVPPAASARDMLDMKPGSKLILAVGRMDYTKGIPEFLNAFRDLLTRHPEWVGKAHLYYVAAPSRGEVESYRSLHRECLEISRAIQEEFGTEDYTPLAFVDRHVGRTDLRALYREADVCAVPSLHDGMNLVAKEFVAERDDDQGVLVLSRFAGATQELPEALAVNPFDTAKLSAALKAALDMPAAEQTARMRRMRETVRSKNIYRWAGRMLEDAVQVRARKQLLKRGAQALPRPRRAPSRAASEITFVNPERKDAKPTDTG